jgi:hypothetical protein
MNPTHPSTEDQEIVPQRVYWGRNAGLPAGIRVCDEGSNVYRFVIWSELKAQLEQLLLPQLLADSRGFTVDVIDYYDKKDWLVRVFDPAGKPYCALWFGPDPDKGWHVDGLVRAGVADRSPAAAMTYQRLSDGSYRRIGGSATSLDETKRFKERKHLEGK